MKRKTKPVSKATSHTQTHTVFLVDQLIRWDAQCSLSGLNIAPHNVLMKVWSYNGFYTVHMLKKNYHYYCYYIIIIAINICINSRQFFFIGSFENLMHDENILLGLHKFNKLSSKIIMKIERFLCVLMVVRWKVAWESMYSHLIDRIARFIQRDSFCTAIAT